MQKMVPRDTKQQERMRLITEYRWVAKRIGQQAALDCFEVVWNTGMCENYAIITLFFINFPIYCKTSCPKHNVKLHNYASRLLRQHVARAYGQDTLYWL